MELNAEKLTSGEEEGNLNLNSGSSSKLNPLEIEHILEKILINLDLKSLRAARQVNRLWNSEGRKILFKNHFIRVPLALFSGETINKKVSEKLKEEFDTFLSYNSFKIPHLSIQCKSDVAVLKIIGEVGQIQEVTEVNEVKCVKSLRWSCQEEESEKLLKYLLYKLPNLKYLDISNSDSFECDKVVMEFCLATRFKKETENPNEPKSKLPLVLPSFSISCDHVNSLRNLEDYEQFSKCEGARIQHLNVGSFNIPRAYFPVQNQNRVVKIIQDFLWRSRETLAELTVEEWEKYFSRITFPEMPKLEKLNLSFRGRGQISMLNPVDDALPHCQSFKFAEVAPNLKEIHLRWLGRVNPEETARNPFWTSVFESSGSAPSVQKLVYGDFSTRGHNIDKLLQTFPNLQDFAGLVIPNPNYESILTSVWKFGKNLNILSFRIELISQALELSNLDRIFTGFSKETVDQINRSKSKDEKSQSVLSTDINVDVDVESLRVNPSILDLKRLKSVDIVIGVLDKNEGDFPEEILSIAGEFAFKLMPKVDFGIRIDSTAPNVVRAAAEKLSQLPNVTFEAFDESEWPSE